MVSFTPILSVYPPRRLSHKRSMWDIFILDKARLAHFPIFWGLITISPEFALLEIPQARIDFRAAVLELTLNHFQRLTALERRQFKIHGKLDATPKTLTGFLVFAHQHPRVPQAHQHCQQVPLL